MKEQLNNFKTVCMEYEQYIKDLYQFIKFMDTHYIWDICSESSAVWKTKIKEPFFTLSIEVSISINTGIYKYQTLERESTIKLGNTCVLYVYFYCSNENNPMYLKYKEVIGDVDKLPLTNSEDIKKATEHIKSIGLFLNNPNIS